MLRLGLIFVLIVFAGCTSKSGPPNASETSAARSQLNDRIQFVEQFVIFRREYEQLEYDIFYANGGSFPPSPSEWDIRIVAHIPPTQLGQWVIAGKRDFEMTIPEWAKKTAGLINVDSMKEWYTDGGRSVGIDRNQSVIAYRNFAY